MDSLPFDIITVVFDVVFSEREFNAFNLFDAWQRSLNCHEGDALSLVCHFASVNLALDELPEKPHVTLFDIEV